MFVLMCLAERNIALGKPTYQSSTFASFTAASKAVDGNRNGDLDNGHTCTATAGPTVGYPWWAVDFGIETFVFKLNITNRSDRHGKCTVTL